MSISLEGKHWQELLEREFSAQATPMSLGDEEGYFVTKRDVEYFAYYSAKEIDWSFREATKRKSLPKQWGNLVTKTYHYIQGLFSDWYNESFISEIIGDNKRTLTQKRLERTRKERSERW